MHVHVILLCDRISLKKKIIFLHKTINVLVICLVINAQNLIIQRLLQTF